MAPQYKIVPLSELPLHADFMFGQVMRSGEICKNLYSQADKAVVK